MRVLVTGGTGVLGTHVVALLRNRGDEVRVLTRRPGVAGAVAGDLVSGEGLAEACEGMDAVAHLASAVAAPREWDGVDVGGTRLLGQAACRAGVSHMVLVSILGVDHIPMGYYRAKLAAEHALSSSGVPWTVLRLAQFHELVDAMLRLLAKAPVVPVPRGVSVQPIAAADAARVVVDALDAGPRYGIIGAGGPQTLTVKEAAEQWLAARREAGGRGGAVVQVPVPGPVIAGFRAGHNLMPASSQPGIPFGDWSRERLSRHTPPAYRL